MKVIVVNGAPCSGKDTFVNFCLKKMGNFGRLVSSVDFVKYIAKKCGWNGEKTLKNRKFLSDLKDLLTEWDDVPYKKIYEEIVLFKNELEEYDIDDSCSAVFVMCREPKEIQKIVDRLNAIAIYITRVEAENQVVSNHADANVKEFNYNEYIDNNGTLEELEEKANDFIERIIKNESNY